LVERPSLIAESESEERVGLGGAGRRRTSGTRRAWAAAMRDLRGGLEEEAEQVEAGEDAKDKREEVRRAKESSKEERSSLFMLLLVALDAVGDAGAEEYEVEAVTPDWAERWGDATKDWYAARLGSSTSARVWGGGAKE
jgi:hypothetical protein